MISTPERREPRFVYLSDAESPGGDWRYVGVDPRFGWRLDAANHRPLARAARLCDSVVACREAASEVRDRRAELAVVFGADAERGLWTWRVALEGTRVAGSAHAYQRRIECVRAYSQFVAALDVADPADGVVRNFGPRALRTFDNDAVAG